MGVGAASVNRFKWYEDYQNYHFKRLGDRDINQPAEMTSYWLRTTARNSDSIANINVGDRGYMEATELMDPSYWAGSATSNTARYMGVTFNFIIPAN